MSEPKTWTQYKAEEVNALEAKLEVSEQRVRVLEAEVKVRSGHVNFEYTTPERFRRRGYNSAYRSGWEAGFRGWELEQCYTQHHLAMAYVDGYNDGKEEAEKRIAALTPPQAATTNRR